MNPDELVLQQLSVHHVAKKLKIEDTDFKSVNELLEEIQSRDAQTRGLLTDFMDAHLDWDYFHEKNRVAERQGVQSAADGEKLAQLVGRRNATRSALTARMKELG